MKESTESPPPVPLNYATPASNRSTAPTTGQVVNDTVIGLNLRLKDNLIQLASIIIGALAGAGIGYYVWRDVAAALGCALAGLFVALLLSGMVIGIVRFIFAVKGRRLTSGAAHQIKSPRVTGAGEFRFSAGVNSAWQ